MDEAHSVEHQLSARLVEAYAPLIGRVLKALVWMPLACDTPALVDDLGDSFTFSGGVILAFADAPVLFLTWSLRSPYMLEATAEAAWEPFSLNRVRASPEPPWDQVEGHPLVAVEFFASRYTAGGVIGVRHRFEGTSEETPMWIGVGYADGIRDGDDLWVSVGGDPPNFADLALVQTVGGEG